MATRPDRNRWWVQGLVTLLAVAVGFLGGHVVRAVTPGGFGLIVMDDGGYLVRHERFRTQADCTDVAVRVNERLRSESAVCGRVF